MYCEDISTIINMPLYKLEKNFKQSKKKFNNSEELLQRVVSLKYLSKVWIISYSSDETRIIRLHDSKGIYDCKINLEEETVRVQQRYVIWYKAEKRKLSQIMQEELPYYFNRVIKSKKLFIVLIIILVVILSFIAMRIK